MLRQKWGMKDLLTLNLSFKLTTLIDGYSKGTKKAIWHSSSQTDYVRTHTQLNCQITTDRIMVLNSRCSLCTSCLACLSVVCLTGASRDLLPVNERHVISEPVKRLGVLDRSISSSATSEIGKGTNLKQKREENVGTQHRECGRR